MQVGSQARVGQGDVVKLWQRLGIAGGGNARPAEPGVTHRWAVNRAEMQLLGVARIAGDQRQRRTPVVGAAAKVVRSVHWIHHPGSPACRRRVRPLFAHDAVLGAQGRQRASNEALGGVVGICDHVGNGRFLLCLHPRFAHPPGQPASVKHQCLCQVFVRILVVGDHKGFGHCIDHGVELGRVLRSCHDPYCALHSGDMHAVGLCTVQPDVTADINDLNAALTTIEKVLDLDGMAERVRELEAQASDPSLWDDPDHAQQVTSQLSHVQAELRRVTELRQRLDDLPILYEFAEEEGDGIEAADEERAAVRAEIETLEVKTMLSGEYDAREALINIRSGAGGVDAADWAEMLLRMYTRWAEKAGYSVDIYDISYAEEAGIKSATFVVHGEYTYGTLSVEQGAHRLVRISPFDNQGRRQTSFAEVEVLPVVEQTDHIEVPDSEIRVDVYRSSGPGGQSVNTTDSAVRLTHIPTGIVVTCQNEKSQIQNKASAMRVLQAKLLERKRQEERAELDALGAGGNASWGNQMRSYVLHPYQMVKDLRTKYEVNDPSQVLDGEIDGFLEAGIRWRMAEEQQNS